MIVAVAAVFLVGTACGSKDKEKGAQPAGKAAEKKESVQPEPVDDEGSDEEVAVQPVETTAPVTEKTATTAPAVAAATEPESTLVARVNGVELDAQEQIARMKQRFQGEFKPEMLRRPLVERMVKDELIRQEVEKLQIQVTDQELADIMKLDVETVATRKETEPAKVDLYRKKVAERKLLEVRGLLVPPSEEELSKQYEQENILNLQTVTFPVRPNATEEVEALSQTLAADTLSKVRTQGLTLQDAVKDMKDADGRRVIVKPLIVKKGDKRYEELWTAAENVQENEVAGPVKTRRGHVVFQVARKRVPQKSFEEMKDELTQRLLNMKMAQARHRLLADLEASAKIEYLVEFAEPALPGTIGAGRPGGPFQPNVQRPPRIPGGLQRLPAGRDLPGLVTPPPAAAPVAPETAQ
jgi:hypothetical protein